VCRRPRSRPALQQRLEAPREKKEEREEKRQRRGIYPPRHDLTITCPLGKGRGGEGKGNLPRSSPLSSPTSYFSLHAGMVKEGKRKKRKERKERGGGRRTGYVSASSRRSAGDEQAAVKKEKRREKKAQTNPLLRRRRRARRGGGRGKKEKKKRKEKKRGNETEVEMLESVCVSFPIRALPGGGKRERKKERGAWVGDRRPRRVDCNSPAGKGRGKVKGEKEKGNAALSNRRR